jgi:ABC-type Zn uptake system ZnuABC Zn-binding protein ZnuA
MNKTILVAIFLVYFPVTFARTFSCTHPEICRVANIILAETKTPEIFLENIIVPSGDPHEFEPSIQDIKKLVSAKELIIGPVELNPWIKNIEKIRSKEKNLITHDLSLTTLLKSIYPTTETEALGHFWLYPKIYCHMKSSLAAIFKIIKPINCNPEIIEGELSLDLKNIKYPIVLTHDALLPLLKKLSLPTQQIIAIKGSSHHGEVPSSAIKKVYDALKAPKIIWILENNIATAENIKNKIRDNDIIIKIDTAQSPISNIDFSLLESLHKKLQEIKK